MNALRAHIKMRNGRCFLAGGWQGATKKDSRSAL